MDVHATCWKEDVCEVIRAWGGLHYKLHLLDTRQSTSIGLSQRLRVKFTPCAAQCISRPRHQLNAIGLKWCIVTVLAQPEEATSWGDARGHFPLQAFRAAVDLLFNPMDHAYLCIPQNGPAVGRGWSDSALSTSPYPQLLRDSLHEYHKQDLALRLQLLRRAAL